MFNESDSEELRLWEQLWSRSVAVVITECIIVVVVASSTLIGNVLILLSLYRNSRLRTNTNYLIVSMAIADLLISILPEPLIFPTISGWVPKWNLGFAVCQIQGFTTVACVTASILNASLVAINRYFHIVWPNCYRKYVSKRSIISIILFIWVLSMALPATYLVTGHRFSFHPGVMFCLQEEDTFLEPLWVVFGSVSLIVMLSCYFYVFRKIKSHKDRIGVSPQTNTFAQTNVQEIKVTKTLLSVVLGFSICWSVVVATDIASLTKGHYSLPRPVYFVHTLFGAASSAINAFIYGFTNREFRLEFLRILRFSRCSSVTNVQTRRSK